MIRVLVIDDSATDRVLAGGLLQRAGGKFDVSFAEDGRDGLTKIKAEPPDVVLTDLNMPELDGFQLVEAVRKAHLAVPVILMTNKGSEETAVRALKFGAAHYVVKTRLKDELVEIVEQVIEAARAGRNHQQLMRCVSEQRVVFAVPNDQELLAYLVQYLQQEALNHGICDDSERVRVGVALQEALTNACFHGNLEVSSRLREQDHRLYYDLAQQRTTEAPYASRKVHVIATFRPGEAIYVIRDEGPGFDLAELPDPTDPENLERPCGRGLLLMRTFMDEVRYNDKGNEVTMIKRRRTTPTLVR